MAKQTTKKVEVEETAVAETVEKTESGEVEAKIKRPVYANKFTVTLKNGTVRVYTPFTHGKVWEALARNFAESNEGSTIE